MEKPYREMKDALTIRWKSEVPDDQFLMEHLVPYHNRSHELKRLALIGLQYEKGILQGMTVNDVVEAVKKALSSGEIQVSATLDSTDSNSIPEAKSEPERDERLAKTIGSQLDAFDKI